MGKWLLGVLTLLCLGAVAPGSAHEPKGRASVDWTSNRVQICWEDSDCIVFGPANIRNTASWCSQDTLWEILDEEYQRRTTDRIQSFGGVSALINVLQRDQTGTVWPEFHSCTDADFHQGLLCVDLDEQVDTMIFEGCYYVTEE